MSSDPSPDETPAQPASEPTAGQPTSEPPAAQSASEPTDILAIAAMARAATGEEVPPFMAVDPQAWLEALAAQLRAAPGVARKAPLGPLVVAGLPDPEKLAVPGLLRAWRGEDAAALDLTVVVGLAAALTGGGGDGSGMGGAGGRGGESYLGAGGGGGASRDGSPATEGEPSAETAGRGHLLLTADGLRPDLLEADPYWAGFCSVIVNVNDILAMGGRPLALLQVVAYGDAEQGRALTRGIGAAAAAYGVPVVGGHTHPPAPDQAKVLPKGEEGGGEGPEATAGAAATGLEEVVEAKAQTKAPEGDPVVTVTGTEEINEAVPEAVSEPPSEPLSPAHLSVMALGVAGPELLRSNTARAGEALVVAVDLRGDFKPDYSDDEYKKESVMGGPAFDTIVERSAPELARLCGLLPQVAAQGLARACKDLSNPGLVGTLAMLAETSGVGAVVDLAKLPRPAGVAGPPPFPEAQAPPGEAGATLGDEAAGADGTDPTEREAKAENKGPPLPVGERGRPLLEWLLAYPGYGFVFATPPEQAEALCRLFAAEGVTAAVCGAFTPVRKVQLSLGRHKAPVWDLGGGDTLTGLGPD